MKLLTKQLEERFKQVGSQEEEKDPLVIVKFFNPVGMGTWYATEYDPKDKIFFGFVSLYNNHNDEWGSFSLEQLENLELPFGLTVERDLHIDEKPISKICPKAIK